MNAVKVPPNPLERKRIERVPLNGCFRSMRDGKGDVAWEDRRVNLGIATGIIVASKPMKGGGSSKSVFYFPNARFSRESEDASDGADVQVD